MAICKKFADANREYRGPVKELMKTLLMLDEIDEIGGLDDLTDEDIAHITFQISKDLDSIDELGASNNEKGVTLEEMLKNLELTLPKDRK